MANYFVKSGSGATQFAQSTAYSAGARIVPLRTDTGTNHTRAKGYVWECTTAGTTAAANPTWPASVTVGTTTVTSGTAVFTARSPGYSSGSTVDWTFATIFLDYVCNATYCAGGDTIYVSNNHAETHASESITIYPQVGSATAPVVIVCVGDTVTSGFTCATTATITTTVGTIVHYAYSFHYTFGITFTSGYSGTGGLSVVPLYNTSTWEKCNFVLTSTSSAGAISVATGGSGLQFARFIDCGIKLGNASQTIFLERPTEWIGGSILSGGTSPTVLFTLKSSTSGNLRVTGMDISNGASTIDLLSPLCHSGMAIFRNCKLPASWTGDFVTADPSPMAFQAEMHNCDSADTNYRFAARNSSGTIVNDAGVYNDAGADDGSAAGFSWKMVSNASTKYPVAVLWTPEIVKWNETTGSSVTATVEIVHSSQGSGTNGVLNDDEIWLEVQYLGTTGYPISTIISDARTLVATAAAQDTSSAAWTGDSAGWDTQKLSVTFTPQEKGFIHSRVVLAKASATVYVDPLLTVA